MIRRDFLVKSGWLSSLFLLPSIANAAKIQDVESSGVNEFYTHVRRKVMLAMLSMQKQNWEHGIAAQAFVEIGDVTMMVLMAKEAVVRQDADGRLAVLGVANGITDSAASGEAVLRTAALLNNMEMVNATDKMLFYFLNHAPKSKDGLIYHSHHGPELWADSMYMAPPFFAFAGHPYDALKQISGIHNRLWIKEKSLFAYRWNEELQFITNPRLWGLANGHALHGMAKLIEYLPETMADEKVMLVRWVKEHLEGCFHVMRSDYLFHDTLDDDSSFVETSLSMRMAYTIFKGVKQGWLSNSYLNSALRMREAVNTQIDDFGFVTGVPGPPSYSVPTHSTEGQAFYLMMEAAYDALKL